MIVCGRKVSLLPLLGSRIGIRFCKRFRILLCGRLEVVKDLLMEGKGVANLLAMTLWLMRIWIHGWYKLTCLPVWNIPLPLQRNWSKWFYRTQVSSWRQQKRPMKSEGSNAFTKGRKMQRSLTSISFD